MEYNQLNINATVEFDNDRKHRYFLSYIWDTSKPILGVIMFNTSVADENAPDKTHARLINLLSSKYGGIKVLNLISFISTDPKNLNKDQYEKVVSVDVINYLDKLDTQNILFAWGMLPKKLKEKLRNDVNTAIQEILIKYNNKHLFQLNKEKIVHPLVHKKIELYSFIKENLVKF